MAETTKIAWPAGQLDGQEKKPTRVATCEIRGCSHLTEQRVGWYANGATEKRVAFMCNVHATARLNDLDEPQVRECRPSGAKES